ncbi:MAG: T9SS type A sorting domain-containing protein, partial [Bacteroidia bacterium]
FTGVNNIADLRIYSGDISNPSTSTITFNELVSNTGSSIILSNGAFLYSFANNVAYFTGINNLGGNLSIFATDSGNVNTHVVQELMTAASWISTSEGRFYLCNDQLYFYGADYKIGTTLYAGRNLSTCDSTSGSLKEVVLNAGANATIENMVNFKESLIFSIGSLTSNQLYAIHACASAPIATNALQDYNNASNTTIYPNPNNGTFTIHTPTNATVVIYNMLGEIVYNYTTNASTTPLALTLTTGVYVAKTISTTGSSTTKFIVE